MAPVLVTLSCARLISDEFPDFEDLPAVNCMLVSGDSLTLHVSLAQKLDSTELTLIDDASVQLTQGESGSFQLSYQDNGIYTSNHLVEPKAAYQISVLLDGYPEILAHDSVPTTCDISILSQTNNARLDEEGYFDASIELGFTDDPETEDYYELLMYKRTDNYSGLTHLFNEQSPILLNEGFEPYTTESLLFSDELMEGEEVKMNLFYSAPNSSGSYDNFRRYHEFQEHALIAEFRHVSKEYYLFMKSRYFYENTRYADFIEGTSTAYPIYSNVENGLGIVAAYSSSMDSIFIEADTIYYTRQY